MKRFARSILGVTLLEIMLVLAIAAMILVMSVRYYNAANSSQQANAFIQTIQAIIGAAGQLTQETGSMSAVSGGQITNLLGSTALNLPWGGTLSISGSTDELVMSIPGAAPSPGVCALILRQISNLGGVTPTSGADCSVFTYVAGATT